MTTYARAPLEEAFAVLAAELDDILGRVLRRTPHLILDSELLLDWKVVDTANGDVVMLHSPDIMVCVRFMEAFALKHPEATVERWSIAEAVRMANIAFREVAGEPKADAATPMAPVSQAAPDGEPASPATYTPADGRTVPCADYPALAGLSERYSVKVPPLRLVEAAE